MCPSDLATADSALVLVSWRSRRLPRLVPGNRVPVMVRQCFQRFLQKDAAWRMRQLSLAGAEPSQGELARVRSSPTAQ